MLAVSLLYVALLVACGGESPAPTRDAVPTVIPTEAFGTVPAEPPARGDTVRNRERTPASATSRAFIPTKTPEPTEERRSSEPTEPAPTATPAARTVDICNRQESVREAILGELGLDVDACEEVP